ncbi:MAG TPA: hypothetical protein VOA87_21160 [Thermoanaerobaculia bacterium]|nr:hypothetical protein [Thermoanaerobaculia bacterium]
MGVGTRPPRGGRTGHEMPAPSTPNPPPELPRVNAVGLLERPLADETPRRFSRRQRLLAGLFVLLFVLVTVASTVASLGRYCLTTDGMDTRALRAHPTAATQAR